MKSIHFFTLTVLFLATLLLSPTYAQGVKTIIIDPGHGGIFPGAVYKGTKEKDLNLAVALKLGALIKKELPAVKVVYTRTTDIELSKSLAQDLHKRTVIANKAQADLFISIHANAAKSTAAYGVETILMGETSVEQQRQEAAIYSSNRDELLDMSNEKTAAIVRAYIQNLQFTYGEYSEGFARLIQKNFAAQGRKDRGLRKQLVKVLYGTDMPCALTEIGFMTNAKELTYMKSQKGQNEIAQAIFGGIKDYVNMVNKTISTSTPPPTPAPTPKSSTPKKSTTPTTGYTIQILSSATVINPNDSQFKSYKGKAWYQVGTGRFKYRYCIGKFSTKKEADAELKKVQRSFKDAFITTYSN